jgi:hypothetical protein
VSAAARAGEQYRVLDAGHLDTAATFLGKLVYHKSSFTEPPPLSFVHTHLTILISDA